VKVLEYKAAKHVRNVYLLIIPRFSRTVKSVLEFSSRAQLSTLNFNRGENTVENQRKDVVSDHSGGSLPADQASDAIAGPSDFVFQGIE
jgi:3-deoxy-D-manno-octulosonic-acid transferase